MNQPNHVAKRLGALLALLLAAAVCCGCAATQTPVPNPTRTLQPLSVGQGIGRREPGLVLESSHALLFDPANGEILYAKGMDDRVYPASITKVMTALVALEGIADLDAPIVMQHADYAGLYEQNASMAGFLMGETVTGRDLLYAAMLPSGGEAARALARAGSGSVEAALERMNQRAVQLGMENTHFVNVTGLHDEAHYTTVKDLALLWGAALQNEELLRACQALTYTAVPTEQHPKGLPLVSTLVPKLQLLERELPPILGGKTGYTEEAGLCLMSVAEQSGVRRAVITIGGPGDPKASAPHLLDAYRLYDRALPPL